MSMRYKVFLDQSKSQQEKFSVPWKFFTSILISKRAKHGGYIRIVDTRTGIVEVSQVIVDDKGAPTVCNSTSNDLNYVGK